MAAAPASAARRTLKRELWKIKVGLLASHVIRKNSSKFLAFIRYLMIHMIELHPHRVWGSSEDSQRRQMHTKYFLTELQQEWQQASNEGKYITRRHRWPGTYLYTTTTVVARTLTPAKTGSNSSKHRDGSYKVSPSSTVKRSQLPRWTKVFLNRTQTDNLSRELKPLLTRV